MTQGSGSFFGQGSGSFFGPLTVEVLSTPPPKNVPDPLEPQVTLEPPQTFTASLMARWPRHVWTTLFTYLVIFLGFPLLCLLAYAWVRGWL
jgi:hypothetical protein